MVDDVSVRRLADGLDSHSAAGVEEHSRQLDACLDADLYGSAVVALSAGFESMLRQGLIEELEGHENYLAERRIDAIEAGQARYSSILEEARERDVIDESIHQILDGLRDERNSYVHSDSRAISRADVDEHGDLEAGHELYRQVLEDNGMGAPETQERTVPHWEKQWPLGRVRVTG